MKPRITWMLVLCSLSALWAAPLLAEKDDEQQQFLFLVEPAYTQEQGEWQISLAAERANNLKLEEGGEKVTFDRTKGSIEVEYGVTDRLQLNLEVPYESFELQVGDGKLDGNGFNDIEFGVSYAVVEEHESWPEISLWLSASAPTGDSDRLLGRDVWGYEIAARTSKRFTDRLTVHAEIVYEMANNVKVGDETFDETELSYGVALGYEFLPKWTGVVEFAGAHEKEKGDDGTEELHPAYGLLGLVFEINEHASVGIAGALGLNDDSFDDRLFVRAQFEW